MPKKRKNSITFPGAIILIAMVLIAFALGFYGLEVYKRSLVTTIPTNTSSTITLVTSSPTNTSLTTTSVTAKNVSTSVTTSTTSSS